MMQFDVRAGVTTASVYPSGISDFLTCGWLAKRLELF